METPNYTDLLESLNALTSAVAMHAQYLETHKLSMENLTLAIKELQDALQHGEIEIKQPSQHLKQALTAFVETYINPRFYQPLKLLNNERTPS